MWSDPGRCLHTERAFHPDMQVLDKDAGNVKGLYRRAQSNLALGNLMECEADLQRALLEEPGNKDVRALFRVYKAKVCIIMDNFLYLVMLAYDTLWSTKGTDNLQLMVLLWSNVWYSMIIEGSIDNCDQLTGPAD